MKNKRLTAEEYIEKCKKFNPEYDITTYKNNKIPIRIICPIHGEFKQAIGDHLKGYGCSKCLGKYKPTTEEWIITITYFGNKIYFINFNIINNINKI